MNTLSHPGGHHIPENDAEKRGELIHNVTTFGSDTPGNTKNFLNCSDHHDIPPTTVLLKGRLARWNTKVESLAGLEARGITRVLPEEKHGGGFMGYLQMFALWFGINLVAPNMIVGFLGPLVFNLGWVDCVCIVIFANALSSCGASYTATFSPQSGNRTMVCLRARCIPLTQWNTHKLGLRLLVRCGAYLLHRSSVVISWDTGRPRLSACSTSSINWAGVLLDASLRGKCSRRSMAQASASPSAVSSVLFALA